MRPDLDIPITMDVYLQVQIAGIIFKRNALTWRYAIPICNRLHHDSHDFREAICKVYLWHILPLFKYFIH